MRTRHPIVVILASVVLMLTAAGCGGGGGSTNPGVLFFTSSSFSVAEDGTPLLAVTVRRLGGADHEVTATIALTDGTATGGPAPLVSPVDYANTPIVVTFADGDVADKVVTVPILNDSLVEPNETVHLALTSPTGGASIGDQATATLTILNNDVAGTLAFSAAAFTATEAGAQVLPVTVRRTGGSDGAVTVTVTPSNGTATGGLPGSGADFDNTPVVVSFADHDTTDKLVNITIFQDNLVEGSETVLLTLSNPTGGASVGALSTATLTINDDDGPGIVVFSAANYTYNEDGTTTAAVSILRTGDNDGAISVEVQVTDGTANSNPASLLEPVDFSAASPQIVSWADQDTAAKGITVTIVNDLLPEAAETFSLTLANPTGGATVGAQGTATVTINDNDASLVLNHPTPATNDQFGLAVARVGAKAAIGAPNVTIGSAAQGGAIYLYDATGLLTGTITKATPASGDHFAQAMSSSGTSLAVGVPGDSTAGAGNGAVYVYDASSGALRTIIYDPNPAGTNHEFGFAVAISGNFLVVGAPNGDAGGQAAGRTYVFDVISGTLITSMSKPGASAGERFGHSVAMTGTHIAVGTPGDDFGATDAGSVCIFDMTTGGLLVAIANPFPANADAFGSAVADFNGRIVVGCAQDDQPGFTDAGATYVFDGTTGALLNQLVSPHQTPSGAFGATVRQVGNRLAVAATHEVVNGGASSGRVYVYDGSLTLVQTIEHPAAANGDLFGGALADFDGAALIGIPLRTVSGLTNVGQAAIFHVN